MREALDTDVAIETPEHIVFHYRVAGPARRALGYVVDVIAMGVAFTILAVIVLLAIGASGSSLDDAKGTAGFGVGVLLLLAFAAQWLWFLLWEAIAGRSPGKMAAGLRVVTTSGRPIGWRASALRNLMRTADFLPFGYLAGVVSMALTKRFQRLGDLVAGTMVVVPQAMRAAGPLEVWPPLEPKEVATLPEEVLLDADERLAIEMFLRRRHRLGLGRERELATMIAGPIASRIGFRHADPARLLALVYDRAVNAGRGEAPPSSFRPPKNKKTKKKREKRGGETWP